MVHGCFEEGARELAQALRWIAVWLRKRDAEYWSVQRRVPRQDFHGEIFHDTTIDQDLLLSPQAEVKRHTTRVQNGVEQRVAITLEHHWTGVSQVRSNYLHLTTVL